MNILIYIFMPFLVMATFGIIGLSLDHLITNLMEG